MVDPVPAASKRLGLGSEVKGLQLSEASVSDHHLGELLLQLLLFVPWVTAACSSVLHVPGVGAASISQLLGCGCEGCVACCQVAVGNAPAYCSPVAAAVN
jgi:hypothetical protein